MVGEQVVERPVLAHGDPLRAGKVILGHDAVIDLVVRADIVGGHAAHHRLDLPAVAVIGEGGNGRSLHQRRLVRVQEGRRGRGITHGLVVTHSLLLNIIEAAE